MVLKMRTLSLPIPRTKEDLLVIQGCPLKTFSLRHLKVATDNFSNKNILGRGGFGCVYRGRLADGSFVAIKRLNKELDRYGKLQFQTEVDLGGSPASNHRNVLRLLGYCMTRKERILVYPFMVHRSVASRLRELDPSETPLDWCTRKRIALGAAKGLAHLHYGSSFTVIHRDVKPANILLDEQFEAILCDFGLAKFVGRKGNKSNSSWAQRPTEEHYDDDDLSEEEDESDQESHQENKCFTKSCWNFTRTVMVKAKDGQESRVIKKNEVISESRGKVALATYHESSTHVSTAVCGTFGYLDPDYFRTQKCSVKSDVYAYGVTLLELLTGQKAIDSNRPRNEINLLEWVERIVGDDNLDSVINSELRGDYIMEELKQLVQLALACTEDDLNSRPVMTEVINIIESMGQSPSAATTQLIKEQFEHATTDPTNSVQFESTTVQPPEKATLDVATLKPVHLPQVMEPGTNNNKRHDFQVNISSGDFSLSFKFSGQSVLCVILLISLSMNLVSIWGWAKPRY